MLKTLTPVKKSLIFISIILLGIIGAKLTIAGEVTTNPMEFQQPLPKVSDTLYEEAIKAEKAGNPNAVLFMGKVREGYQHQQKEQKLDEPEDVFMGCVLYQIGGTKALDSVDFAHTVDVLAGVVNPKTGKEYTEEDAKALVKSFNQEQGIILYKLYKNLQYYAYSCYAYVHHGFIVMPSSNSMMNYALDK